MNMNKPTDEPIDFPVGPKEVTALVDIVSRLSLYTGTWNSRAEVSRLLGYDARKFTSTAVGLYKKEGSVDFVVDYFRQHAGKIRPVIQAERAFNKITGRFLRNDVAKNSYELIHLLGYDSLGHYMMDIREIYEGAVSDFWKEHSEIVQDDHDQFEQAAYNRGVLRARSYMENRLMRQQERQI